MKITEQRCLKCLKEACLDRVMEEFYPWAFLEDDVLLEKVARNISKSIISTARQQLINDIIHKLCEEIYQKEADSIIKKITDKCSIKILSEIRLEVKAKCIK